MANKLPAETIILGFTGSIGSGCSFIGKHIEELGYDYKYFCLSDHLKELAKSKKIANPTCEQLQDIGNDLRKKSKKGSVLVSELLKKIDSQIKSGALDLSKYKGIIIDSIRNDGEVLTLRQFPNFFLFSVHADKDTRKNRTLNDKKFKNAKEFEDADKRDQAEREPHGQHVKECNELADIIINNDTDFAKTARQSIRKYIEGIYNKYIVLIENNINGKLTPENLPSRNETLMTMAYAESRLSHCLKRKVGAIIASVTKSEIPEEDYDKSLKEIFNIISSGHNEVPLGTLPCAFDTTVNEECNRDFLKEEHARTIVHCPNCGYKINWKTTCTCGNVIDQFSFLCPRCKEPVEDEYECPKCKTQIFSKYLNTGGKLLDMCRSLHAEEQALLNLAKYSGSSKQLILYTSTFPCNLCANKIVASGINKIVYAEPYPMKEAVKILKEGGVESEKFQGIKSSAYFRLYRA